MGDVWQAGESYEPYVGRWSRLVADEFVGWLDLAAGSRCLDVGCGTGALTARLRAVGDVTGVDASPGFLAYAAARQPAATFSVADATDLPFVDGSFDAVVSGLVLNFVPEPASMVAEMRRVCRPGGTVALYVWDYADGMQFMRHFWDVAAQVDAGAPDEAARFPICAPGPLEGLFREGGFSEVSSRDVVVPTVFRDFDDLWEPFLGGQGAAPAYLSGLAPEDRERIRAGFASRVPTDDDGTIALTARAWAVRGTA